MSSEIGRGADFIPQEATAERRHVSVSRGSFFEDLRVFESALDFLEMLDADAELDEPNEKDFEAHNSKQRGRPFSDKQEQEQERHNQAYLEKRAKKEQSNNKILEAQKNTDKQQELKAHEEDDSNRGGGLATARQQGASQSPVPELEMLFQDNLGDGPDDAKSDSNDDTPTRQRNGRQPEEETEKRQLHHQMETAGESGDENQQPSGAPWSPNESAESADSVQESAIEYSMYAQIMLSAGQLVDPADAGQQREASFDENLHESTTETPIQHPSPPAAAHWFSRYMAVTVLKQRTSHAEISGVEPPRYSYAKRVLLLLFLATFMLMPVIGLRWFEEFALQHEALYQEVIAGEIAAEQAASLLTSELSAEPGFDKALAEALNFSSLLVVTDAAVIGLRYVPGDTPLPVVTFKRTGRQASIAVRVAKAHRIPVFHDEALAKKLWQHSVVGDFIPSDTIHEVARVTARAAKSRANGARANLR